MANNLAIKYSSNLLSVWTKASILAGKLTNEYDFVGVRTVRIYSIVTVDLQNYDRTAVTGYRFGTLSEVQDEVQEVTLTQDKAFNLSIDRGNASDQLDIKKAGKVLKQQMEEKVTPATDKYGLDKIAKLGGKTVVLGATTSTSNIVGYLATAEVEMVNNNVPEEGRYAYFGATEYNKLRLSSEFMAVDKLAEDSLGRGVKGTVLSFNIVRVPDSYMPTDASFIIIHKTSAQMPFKLKTLRILSEDSAVDGWLIQGRFYYDAFVLGKRATGIYTALVNGSTKLVATPVITPTGSSHAVTCATGGASIYYTLDGSDPRYSLTRVLYASAVTLTSGQTIKACAIKADLWGSLVASAYYA